MNEFSCSFHSRSTVSSVALVVSIGDSQCNTGDHGNQSLPVTDADNVHDDNNQPVSAL